MIDLPRCAAVFVCYNRFFVIPLCQTLPTAPLTCPPSIPTAASISRCSKLVPAPRINLTRVPLSQTCTFTILARYTRQWTVVKRIRPGFATVMIVGVFGQCSFRRFTNELVPASRIDETLMPLTQTCTFAIFTGDTWQCTGFDCIWPGGAAVEIVGVFG